MSKPVSTPEVEPVEPVIPKLEEQDVDANREVDSTPNSFAGAESSTLSRELIQHAGKCLSYIHLAIDSIDSAMENGLYILSRFYFYFGFHYCNTGESNTNELEINLKSAENQGESTSKFRSLNSHPFPPLTILFILFTSYLFSNFCLRRNHIAMITGYQFVYSFSFFVLVFSSWFPLDLPIFVSVSNILDEASDTHAQAARPFS